MWKLSAIEWGNKSTMLELPTGIKSNDSKNIAKIGMRRRKFFFVIPRELRNQMEWSWENEDVGCRSNEKVESVLQQQLIPNTVDKSHFNKCRSIVKRQNRNWIENCAPNASNRMQR